MQSKKCNGVLQYASKTAFQTFLSVTLRSRTDLCSPADFADPVRANCTCLAAGGIRPYNINIHRPGSCPHEPINPSFQQKLFPDFSLISRF
jgi:hypothetical protein